ncbi:CHASE domain-containing protein [Zhongshania aliphaticivorans]|uniref:CHASE domain-containing protein n=1 Tax=Zhongshania aliphaticivorans TaxID=1470434 RepID=UPI0012E549B4|nr:CHASE domain-containing protein [Zhongshania aliphaticivorans]CAA0082542.1 Sporulation kinase E [Zhongshania aliphaticivorans]
MPERRSLVILVVALAYFLLGKLALLLAIPPGYATAIWPAAGVALAAVMVAGYRVWPGILLGSFLVNINAAPDLGQPIAPLFLSFIVPFVIAVGATLQAFVGAWLIRRYIGFQVSLDNVGEVLRFILLACGLSCVVSAGVGTTTLLVAGLLPAENFVFNWLTWWVGDGLGVMIFTILTFVYLGKPVPVWRSRRRILPLVLLGVSIVAVTLYVFGSRWELSRQQSEFSRYTSQVFNRAQTVIDAHMENLYATRALFEVSNKVTVVEFENFVDGFLERNTGFQAIVWVQHVGGGERLPMEAQMSAERGANVKITRRDDRQHAVPQINKDDYFVIRYIEPLVSNLDALGYDISSNGIVRSALARAAAANRPATTGPIRLVQEREDQLGLVVYLPVDFIHETTGRQGLAGYVGAVFRVPDLMELLLASDYLMNVSASVSALDSGDLIYGGRSPSAQESLFSDSAVLRFADAEWVFRLDADQRFLVGSRSMVPWGMLVAGLLFTGLLGMTLLVLTGQKYSSEVTGEKLKEMLHQLQEAQEHLVEAEKMASLGGLVAGFAHELNTPLGIAITAESTLQSDLGKLDAALRERGAVTTEINVLRRMQEASRIVLANVQRAGALIMSFKQVSVDQATTETRTINLHEYLTDVLMHLSPNYRRSGHEVILDCPPDISIRTVPGGIAQVVINLLSNSLIHAFPNERKGNIRLSVSPGFNELVIQFSDDGIGIPLADQKKIFEPFYTTRRSSGGTGLGLHVVYNTVRRQLKGRISVSSQPDQGAVFEVVLPLMINEFVEEGADLSTLS